MIGDILGDVLIDILGGVLPTPETARGWVVLLLVVNAVAVAVETWVLFAASGPLRGPAWTLVLGSIVGFAGIVTAGVHFVREPYDRLLSAVTIALALIAFAWPVTLLL